MSEDNIHEAEEFLVPVEPDTPVPWRLLFVAVAGVFLVIFTLQNFETVRVEFLWLEFSLPLAVLMMLAVLISAALTFTISAVRRRRKRKRAKPSAGSE